MLTLTVILLLQYMFCNELCVLCIIYKTTGVTISDVHFDPQYTNTETVYKHFTYKLFNQITNWGNRLNCLTPTSQFYLQTLITYMQYKQLCMLQYISISVFFPAQWAHIPHNKLAAATTSNEHSYFDKGIQRANFV